MSQNPNELAGATQEPSRPEPNPSTAREIHPVILEKDYLDFRPKAETEVEESIAPKSSLAPASVVQPTSPTGLEDVSEEDLANPALPNVEKVTSPPTPPLTDAGQPTSSKETSTGKSEPPAKK